MSTETKKGFVIVTENGQKTNYVIVASEAAAETEKAVQRRVINWNCGSNKLFWIPKSIMKLQEDEHGDIQCVLPAWYINKNFSYIR